MNLCGGCKCVVAGKRRRIVEYNTWKVGREKVKKGKKDQKG